VFEGRVEVGAKAAVEMDDADRTRQLKTGESLLVENDGPPRLDQWDGIELVRARDYFKSPAYLRWRADSAERRRNPDLVAYYAFDRDSESAGRLLNGAEATLGKFDGRLGDSVDAKTAPTWAMGRWPGKRSLRFQSPYLQRAIVDDWTASVLEGRMTVAMWLNAAGSRKKDTIVAQCHEIDPVRPFIHFSIFNEAGPSVSLIETAEGRGIALKSKKTDESAVRWQTNRWNHVVYAIGDGRVRAYVNGRLVIDGEMSDDMPSLRPIDTPLAIGGKAIGGTCFDGLIDELMIFKNVLEADEAAELYEQGKP
jgi:hypothetical protein